MLLKFYCSNFKSIREEIEFNMFVGSYKRHESHYVRFRDKNVLRSAAIYGTNGSGKTNILLALEYLQKIVVKGTRDINEKLNVPVFKLSDCKDTPTKFEIHFIANGKRFNYELEITSGIITYERLIEINSKNTEISIFSRKYHKNRTILTIAPNKDKNQKDILREEIYSEELRENQTFFKESINKKFVETQIPFNWFQSQLKFISLDEVGPNSNSNYVNAGLASTFLLDSNFLNASKEIILKANVGIVDFKLNVFSVSDLKSKGFEIPEYLINELHNKGDISLDAVYDGELYSSFKKDDELKFVKISTIHQNVNGDNVEFKFSEESRGIQRLFELLPAIYRSIHKGEIFVIDEIETSFHPVLIKEILNLYLATIPEKSGQIIFTTHESHLLDLDLFRQDEIWFCEKDRSGASRLYSLSEFKPRFDKDIRKGYFEGQFGYIPFLGDLKKLGL
jgi:AAA15 family ATPase/GTPase